MKSKNIQSIINESLFDEVKKTILRENKDSQEEEYIIIIEYVLRYKY